MINERDVNDLNKNPPIALSALDSNQTQEQMLQVEQEGKSLLSPKASHKDKLHSNAAKNQFWALSPSL